MVWSDRKISTVSPTKCAATICGLPSGGDLLSSIPGWLGKSFWVETVRNASLQPVQKQPMLKRIELYRTMIAYSGSYSIEGNKVTHKVDVIV